MKMFKNIILASVFLALNSVQAMDTVIPAIQATLDGFVVREGQEAAARVAVVDFLRAVNADTFEAAAEYIDALVDRLSADLLAASNPRNILRIILDAKDECSDIDFVPYVLIPAEQALDSYAKSQTMLDLVGTVRKAREKHEAMIEALAQAEARKIEAAAKLKAALASEKESSQALVAVEASARAAKDKLAFEKAKNKATKEQMLRVAALTLRNIAKADERVKKMEAAREGHEKSIAELADV